MKKKKILFTRQNDIYFPLWSSIHSTPIQREERRQACGANDQSRVTMHPSKQPSDRLAYDQARPPCMPRVCEPHQVRQMHYRPTGFFHLDRLSTCIQRACCEDPLAHEPCPSSADSGGMWTEVWVQLVTAKMIGTRILGMP